ncbi:MAG: alpha/beta hydrolase [Lewinellaceae bacterium]|nr:alpha/beta hydrolase [Lewinellaceae bacterium]
MNRIKVFAALGLLVSFSTKDLPAQQPTGVNNTRSTIEEAADSNGVHVEKVFFPNRVVPKSDLDLAANLFLPPGFDKSQKYPAIIVGHPASGVKEQTAGLYARKLAEQGYITLAFDASYQGESEGEPRFLEDPSVRVEDFSAATDFLSLHGAVDAGKIGVLGICAGGGYAIKAAQTEHRLKAVATVSMVDLGQLRREGLGGMLKDQLQQRMKDVAEQRTKEAAGEPVKMVSYSSGGGTDPSKVPTMYREIADYYRTPRGYHPRAATGYVFTSLSKLFNFTALDHVELISPRPLLMIVGSIADSRYFSDNALALAAEPKEIFEVEGATHIDMYDKPQYVGPAVDKLTDFFGKNLK